MSSAGGHGGSGELPGLHELFEWMESSNESGGFIIPGWGIILLFLFSILFFNAEAAIQSALNWQAVLVTGPIWMPIVFGRFAMMRFLQMRRVRYNYNNPFVLLELRMPREIRKSPQAMEAVFSNLHLNPGEGTWMKRYWWGRSRPWWSYEIVSIGGTVHFYIYTRVSMRRAVESSFYAQYPEIEIIEAVDYSRLRDPSQNPFQMFACEYKHDKPDPYPIRTYVEYGIDKPGIKPEEQVDPLAQVLELMGSIGPDEQLWTQIVIRVTKSEKFRGKKNADGSNRTWRDVAKELVDDLRKKQYDLAVDFGEEGGTKFPNATEVQKQVIASIERNAGKPGFDVGIRSIYSAPADKYQTMNPFVANIWKPFNTHTTNAILPAPLWSEKFNDYPWEDIGGFRQAREMKEAVEFYRFRSFFHPPYRGPWMVMSAEELASIWHPPSSTVQTPSLPRIGSTTSAAPPNLPT